MSRKHSVWWWAWRGPLFFCLCSYVVFPAHLPLLPSVPGVTPRDQEPLLLSSRNIMVHSVHVIRIGHSRSDPFGPGENDITWPSMHASNAWLGQCRHRCVCVPHTMGWLHRTERVGYQDTTVLVLAKCNDLYMCVVDCLCSCEVVTVSDVSSVHQ